MKRLALLIPVVATVMMLGAPARGEEGSVFGTQVESQATKDECLLVAMNCKDNVDSIQQRIDKLQKEIGRGTDVYTNDELRILNQKLEDANQTFMELLNR
jgi:hypothetical protein